MGEIWNVGLGVYKYKETQSFYSEVLGFNHCLMSENNVRTMPLRYMGNELLIQDVCLLMNKNGGGGIEIWNTTNKILHKLQCPTELGDVGILAILLRAKNIHTVRLMLQKRNIEVSTITDDMLGLKRIYMRDNECNMIGIVEESDNRFKNIMSKNNIGGMHSLIIGTHHIENTKAFYKKMGEFDSVVYDKTGIFKDFCFWKKNKKVRRVILKRSNTKNKGVFGNFIHIDYIELVHVVGKNDSYKKPKDRICYGDPGFFKIGFDIESGKAIDEYTVRVDATPYGNILDGTLFYKEDPNSILSECVEIRNIWTYNSQKKLYTRKKKRKPLSKFRTKLLFLK